MIIRDEGLKYEMLMINLFPSISFQHLITLLAASDMEVVLSVLGVLYVFRYVEYKLHFKLESVLISLVYSNFSLQCIGDC